MSKESPQPHQSEEIDLGQLFKLIGNVFDRFFKFIASIFIGIYNVLLLFLIHLYSRLAWYAAAAVIGIIIGFFMDKNSVKLYSASMSIQTNFKSARQVYENVKQFYQLASVDRDTLELAKRLNISTEEASKLKGFYIEPDLDENEIVEMYAAFYKKLDSASQLDMTYYKYKEALTPNNFYTHRISIASSDKNIYKNIGKHFVDQLSNNDYLEELLKVNTATLNKKDNSLLLQVQKSDALVNEYLKIRKNESQKNQIPNSGTNLYMGGTESKSGNLMVDESKIMQQRLDYENQRIKLSHTKTSQKNIINILANFPQSGYSVTEWVDKKKFVLPIVFVLLTLLIFSFISLGKFLEKKNNLLSK